MNRSLRILLAEDEPAMQRLLLHLLSARGHRVELAPNGLEARSLLRTDGAFDLILSDVMMSGLDGIELCAWVKGEERLAPIPFVLLSSRAQHREREIGIEAGADAYMTKPFDVADLLETIERLVPAAVA